MPALTEGFAVVCWLLAAAQETSKQAKAHRAPMQFDRLKGASMRIRVTHLSE
jgi:hypothetical protein